MKMIRSFVKIFNPENGNKLGRWNLKNNPEITNIFANYDHCGDTLCKDPKEIKCDIDKINKSNNIEAIDYIDYSYIQQKNKM